jgi:hypothetical protein
MAYDKKTGTITITSDDPKEFERDIFRHFEEVDRQLTQDPNCPPEIVKSYEKLKKANKALDDYDKLKAISDQARAMKQVHNSQIKSSSGDPNNKTGGAMKWINQKVNTRFKRISLVILPFVSSVALFRLIQDLDHYSWEPSLSFLLFTMASVLSVFLAFTGLSDWLSGHK